MQIRGEMVLKAVPEQVTFGQSAALSGNSPYPSSPVVISQRPIGSQTEKEIVTITAAEDGSFTASFRPQSGTRVRASAAAGQLRSPFVTVSVAPRVTIAVRPTTLKAGRTVTVTGRVAPANVVQEVPPRPLQRPAQGVGSPEHEARDELAPPCSAGQRRGADRFYASGSRGQTSGRGTCPPSAAPLSLEVSPSLSHRVSQSLPDPRP